MSANDDYRLVGFVLALAGEGSGEGGGGDESGCVQRGLRRCCGRCTRRVATSDNGHHL